MAGAFQVSSLEFIARATSAWTFAADESPSDRGGRSCGASGSFLASGSPQVDKQLGPTGVGRELSFGHGRTRAGARVHARPPLLLILTNQPRALAPRPHALCRTLAAAARPKMSAGRAETDVASRAGRQATGVITIRVSQRSARRMADPLSARRLRLGRLAP